LKYYLSGAITDQPDFKAYFKKYENELRSYGLTDIFNPAETVWPSDVKWETCMKYDIKILMDCDCLLLLPNWRKSKGARVERNLCKKLKIPVMGIDYFVNYFIKGQGINAT
jgi:hypothetical protein